ncbi:MAG: cell division protein FtsQ/DivIB [Elusimicrobiota bacterium]
MSFFNRSKNKFSNRKIKKVSRPRVRPQKVKFRTRYAKSVATQYLKAIGILTGIAVVGFGVFSLGGSANKYWNNSANFKVDRIIWQGDIPKNLPSFLNLKPGTQIFSLKTETLEERAIKKFSELKSLRVSRNLNKDVVIEGEFRSALAISAQNDHLIGIDEKSVVFPLSIPMPQLVNSIWFSMADPTHKTKIVNFLSSVKNEFPDFLKIVKSIETDRIGMLKIVLDNGVIIEWGILEQSNLSQRIKNVLHVLTDMKPMKSSALLKFVTDERIVMDNNWDSIKKKS